MVHTGAENGIVQASLWCPHKQFDPLNLDTLTSQEAEAVQQEQCDWTFGSARRGGCLRDSDLVMLPRFSLHVGRGDPVEYVGKHCRCQHMRPHTIWRQHASTTRISCPTSAPWLRVARSRLVAGGASSLRHTAACHDVIIRHPYLYEKSLQKQCSNRMKSHHHPWFVVFIHEATPKSKNTSGGKTGFWC